MAPEREASVGRLAGKVVIVSGAASGMGTVHVRAMLAEGASVLGFDRTVGGGFESSIAGAPERTCLLGGDVTSADDWRRIVDVCTERFGAPNVLVNNAGIARAGRLDSTSETEYRQVIDVNQIGALLGMQAVIPAMQRSGGGSVINISSTSGLVAFADNFAYTAAKWAVRGMTRAAALELASAGIRVNTVCPGETDTPLLRADPTALPPEASRFGRWAQPEEISAAVVFLASDESSYMSGSDIVIDAAHTAG